MPGTYDPELNTLYWTTSNPAPDFDGEARPGDDLYTDCVVALDADTGKLKWHFQFTPHDLYDYDANETPVLIDLKDAGVPSGGLAATPQIAGTGQPQRVSLYSRSHRRKIPEGHAICEKAELGQGN